MSSTIFAQEAEVVLGGPVYLKNLDNWHRTMDRWKLRNFVPLVGLHLLKEGENSFGKSIHNDIIVESNNAPEKIGKIIKSGKKVSFIPEGSIEATLEGKKIESIEYTFDSDRNSEKVKNNFITWYIQYVEDDYFLRIIDDMSPLVSSFEPYGYFEANTDLVFEGKYKPYKKDKVIALDNVIGTSQRHNFSGKISFEYKKQKIELEVLDGSFLMFTDETNGKETFPYGRYLRLKVDEKNNATLDFNYAFNPPRSVSLHTTCEIPPKSNHLPFKVLAGEIYEGDGVEIIRPVH